MQIKINFYRRDLKEKFMFILIKVEIEIKAKGEWNGEDKGRQFKMIGFLYKMTILWSKTF